MIPIVLAAVFVVVVYDGGCGFSINMKSVKFNFILMDVLIPFIFYFATKGLCVVINLSEWLKKIFIYMGKSSLVIMFVHATVYNVLGIIPLVTYNIVLVIALKTVAALMIGCLFYKLLSMESHLSLLLLGKKVV